MLPRRTTTFRSATAAPNSAMSLPRLPSATSRSGSCAASRARLWIWSCRSSPAKRFSSDDLAPARDRGLFRRMLLRHVFDHPPQAAAELRQLLRPQVAILLLPGEQQRLDVAVDQVRAVFAARADGREDFAEIVS